MFKKLLTLAAFAIGSAAMWATDYLTDFSGYTVTKTAVYADATNGNAREFWRGSVLDFDVSQETTELPNGVYTFSVQAVYRAHLTGDAPTGIIAYAESGGNQYMAPICNYTDGTTPSESLGGFSTAFETEGNYLNTIPYIIVSNGKVKVGVKSLGTQLYCTNGMWFVFNPSTFKLSDDVSEDVLATALSDVKAQATGLLDSNSDASDARNALETAVTDANAATVATIVDVKQKIDAYLNYLATEATPETPYDVSYYFTNPKYAIRNLDLVGGLITSGKTGALGQPFGWTCYDAGGTGDNGSGNEFQRGQGYNWFSTIGNTTAIDDRTANYDADKTGGYSIYQRIAWNQWAEQTHSAKQTVTLPAGKYKISVPAYASVKNNDYKGYVNFTIGGTNYSNEVTAGSWNVYEKEFTLTAETEVSVDMQFNKLQRTTNVGGQYAFFDGVTLLAYGNPLKDLKDELTALEAGIDDNYLNNSIYDAIVGVERTNLENAKDITAAEETIEAYSNAITSVQAAIDAFTAAKTNYDALAFEIYQATELGMDVSAYAATSESTAATLPTNIENLKVAEYTYITTTYTESATLGDWTEDFGGDLNGEGYVANGPTYFDQWNGSETTRSAKQTVTLPAGSYAISCIARGAIGTSGYLYYKVAGSDVISGSADFNMKGNSGKGVDTSGAANFSNEGTYTNNGVGFGWEYRFITFTLNEETTIEIGLEASIAAGTWVSFYAPELFTTEASIKALRLSEIAEALATVPTGDMNKDVKATLDTKKAAADGASLENTKEELNTILDELNAAIAAANTSIANYAAAKAYLDLSSTFDDDGKASYTADATVAEVKSAYDGATLVALTSEQATAMDAAIIVAAKAQTTAGSDMTLALVNPSFEQGMTGWTNNGLAIQDNNSFEKDGNLYAEYWQPNGTFGVSQTVTLPVGTYHISAKAKARGVTSAKIFAAGIETSVTVGDATDTYTVEFLCDDNTEVTFGFEGTGTGAGNSWLCVDDFHLTLVSKELNFPDLTAVTGKMNAEVSAAQTAAINTYNEGKTVANYNAAEAAIAAAQSSVNAYAAAAAALTKANTTLGSTNVYTAEAYTAFKDVIDAAQAPYDEGTMTDAEANNLDKLLNGDSATQMRNFVSGAWTATNNANIYTNNWSWEGGNEGGSGMLTPFIEYWTPDANKLADTDISATLTELPTGLYKVSAFMRVMNNKTGEGDTGYDGVTLAVNDGNVVAFANATQYTDGYAKTIEAEGLVKDGTLVIKVSVANTNASWLAMKNVNYTKVRDLTEEEMAVVPMGVALYNGEVEVTEPINLTATANTVTLTPKFSPENATATATWSSSNEAVATVADGVVTGIAPGIAEITVTSTLDATVTASVMVNVSYPESTIPATVEVIDETEMTKTIYTLAQENLIKNGSFEYPNGVGGWKTVGYMTDAVASNFTITTEGGIDNGAYLTTNGYNASSEKTIRQSMPVVAGKTYYFAVYTSGKAPSSDNFQYNALFKMTDATTEHGVLKQFEWPQGAGNTSTEWSKTEYFFTADAEHPYVGVRMGWNENSSFDNFVLAEVTKTEVIDMSATADDYTALNAAIAAAEGKTLGFLQDEYAPYNNVTALQALAAAKAINQEAKNWPADVQAATGALNTAIWTVNTEEVNAVYNGDFGLSTANTTSGKDVDAPGWVAADGSIRLIIDNATTYPALAETTAGKAAFAWDGTYNYGGKVGYTMPLAAHTVYELTFKHAGWNGANNNFSVSVKNSDNEGLATQSCGKSSAGPQTAGCWSTYVVRFTTGAAGDYTLSMMPNGNSTFTDITLFQVPVSEVTMRIRKANKYGTFVAPFDVVKPADVEVLTVTGLDDNTLVLEEVALVEGKIPANTPVIINKEDFEEEDSDFETKFYGQATSTEETVSDGHYLTGVLVDGIYAPIGSYVLQNLDGKVAFYLVGSGENQQPKMRVNSAYLTLLESSDAKSLSFGDDEATAIAGIEALTSGNMEGIYTTSGAKVNSLQKGVNIIRTKDGKSMKVYVK